MVIKYAFYDFNPFELEVRFMVQNLSRSTLTNALCVLENNVYSIAIQWSILEMSLNQVNRGFCSTLTSLLRFSLLVLLISKEGVKIYNSDSRFFLFILLILSGSVLFILKLYD